MTTLRVMLLVTDLQRGGTPMRLARLAPALRSRGIEALVGCLTGPGPLSQAIESKGVTTFSCGAAHRFDVRCLRRLARAIARFDPDLIHATLFHANVAARLVGRLDRARPIVTGTATIEVERSWHRWIESLTARLSTWHVANSEAVAAHLRDELGFDASRLVVIRNPVDVEAIDAAPVADRGVLGIAPDRPLLAWAGRMDRVKRLDVLVEAVEIIQRVRPVSVVLLGDGPERARIHGRLEGRAWRRAAFVPGWREDIVGWLKAADLFLFPSLTEGSPNAVLEAMAAGCCVVASDIPACRELIVPGETGMLVRSGSAEALAQAALALLEDAERRRAMVAGARRVVCERYGIERVVAELSEFYWRVMEAM